MKRKKYFDWEQAFHFIWQNADQTESGTAMLPLWQRNLTCLKMLGREVLDHLRARRLIEKLYTGKYIIVSWRDRDDAESTRHT